MTPALILLGLLLPLQDPGLAPADVEAARKEIRTSLKADFARRSSSDRKELAGRLIEAAGGERETPVMRAAFLLEAVDLAAAARDVSLACTAAGRLRETVPAFPLSGIVDALKSVERSARKAEDASLLAGLYLPMAERRLEADDFDAAEDLARRAQRLAKKARDAGLDASAGAILDRARDLGREYAKVKRALARLKETPLDPDANLAVGSFLCFAKDDWVRGMLHLARGSDEALKRLVQTEMRGADGLEARLAQGDGWWAWGERQSGDVRLAARGRAVKWFREAMPDLVRSKQLDLERKIDEYNGELARKHGGLVEAGNVAAGSRGATIEGAVRNGGLLIDGVTTGYTPSTGFAWGSYPCEWTITLAKTYLLRQLRLLLWDGDPRYYRYMLEVSADGKTYETVKDASTGEPRGWQVVPMAPRRVKYIRVKGLYNSSNSGFHAVELEAYCKPPATPPGTSPR